ncbi:hypothetical protein GCK72_018694 [Caenorhabditis remanei]|uniref:Uncharacterized protein n=1 Tax=Caenorhabditis remanei TaxID=31234 RepID=A0A6A5GAV4_CAERE|nr:hypothetical protein GCK72_018694 [Caenorhabditis remanei]KAF1752140.1 hypothetical protein GCK72_018694 [Caenorhabditis remanei]
MAIRNGFDNEFNTCYVTFPRKCSTTLVDYLRALTSDCADPKITIALDSLHIRKRNQRETSLYSCSTLSRSTGHSTAGSSINRRLNRVSDNYSTYAPAPEELKTPKVSS